MASIISVTAAPADESIGSGFGGTLEWEVVLSEASTDAVTIPYRLFPGTALADVDIPSASGELTFAPGETSRTLGIRASSDNIPETDEAVVVEFYDPVGAEFTGGGASLRVTNFILDDDGSDVDRALYVSSPTIVEGDGGSREAVFDVSVSEAFATTKTFDFSTIDGTARAGTDYTAEQGTVTFVPGQTSVQVRVDVSGDGQAEPGEYFHLAVETDGTIADGGIGATGTGTILDDDASSALPSALRCSTSTSISSYGVAGVGDMPQFI